MNDPRSARPDPVHAHIATVHLHDGTDPRGAGGAITVALCGHWEHEPPCRWPHHTTIDRSGGAHEVRTVFAARGHDIHTVHERIHHALRSDYRWTVVTDRADTPTADEVAKALNWGVL